MLIFEILISLILLVMIYQDFKYRAISWFLIPLILILIIINSLQYFQLKELIYNSLINLGIVVIELLLISLYFTVKNKSFTNIINTYIGLGDILFFLPLCVFFQPINFIVFKLGALFLSLIVFLIYITISKKKNVTIPMAGALSIAFVLVIFFKNIFSSEILNNEYTLGVIMKIYE